MTDATLGAPPVRARPSWAHDLAIGGLYWLSFLLLLEPGNILAAQGAGHALEPGREIVRIAGAALLGTAATPALLWLARRRPVRSTRPLRHAFQQTAGAAGISAALIAVSCPLAAWLIDGPTPIAQAIRDELSANWALVFYGELTFLAAVQLLGREPAAPAPAGRVRSLVATSGRRTTIVDLAHVDWIESQGNYVALHAGDATHLVRGTLRGLEDRLDPGQFVRIHRRRMVAWDRVVDVTALPGGDADLTLRDGRTLRMSRSFAASVRRRI